MRTIWPTGKTARTAMMDDEMRIERPILLGHYPHQIEFHLHGIRVTRQPQQTIDADHMRIHRDPRDAKSVPQNDIGRFPTNSRNLDKIFHMVRNFSTESFENRFRSTQNIFCLISIKARTTNHSLHLPRTRGCQGTHTWIFFKKSWRNLVHKLVCTLGGKDRRDQKLPWRFEMEGATGIRISLSQAPKDRTQAFLF